MVISKIEQEPVVPKFRTKSVTLTLNVEEAYFLKLVMDKIGGCPRTSIRFYANKFGEALSNIRGFNYTKSKEFVSKDCDSIHFVDNSLEEFLSEIVKLDNQ